jgi:DNA-binding transcriptional regulator YbjK
MSPATTTRPRGVAPPELSPRRRRLLDAALHVVADQGLRGLTHRAVDRQAELPEGSCSAYLRTRQALQGALTEYVAGALAADVDRLAQEIGACTGDEDRAVQLAIALFERWLDERELLLAKLELSLEASRNPELAALLGAWRGRLVEVIAQVMRQRDGLLDEAGGGEAARSAVEQSTERAEALAASFDGILLAALLKPARERRGFLSRSLALTMRALTSD